MILPANDTKLNFFPLLLHPFQSLHAFLLNLIKFFLRHRNIVLALPKLPKAWQMSPLFELLIRHKDQGFRQLCKFLFDVTCEDLLSGNVLIDLFLGFEENNLFSEHIDIILLQKLLFISISKIILIRLLLLDCNG